MGTYYIHREVGAISLALDYKNFDFKRRQDGSYDQHSIGNLMLTHSTAKDDHACFHRLAREFIESADVAHNVDY